MASPSADSARFAQAGSVLSDSRCGWIVQNRHGLAKTDTPILRHSIVAIAKSFSDTPEFGVDRQAFRRPNSRQDLNSTGDRCDAISRMLAPS